jgi:hypothetical protein
VSAGTLLLTVLRRGGAPAPVNTVAPSHNYVAPLTPVIGTQITGVAGTWSGSPTITHQWQKALTDAGPWSDVSGATSINYTPLDADSVFGYVLQRLEIPNGDTGAAVASAATGAVTYVPLTMTGMRWYDPYRGRYQDSALTTLADDNDELVGGWVEQAASGSNGTASTTVRPTYKANGFGTGLAALSFDGGDRLDVSGLASYFSGTGKPFTLAIAAKFTSVATFAAFFAAGNTGDALPYIWHGCDNAAKWTSRRRGGVTVSLASSNASDTNTHVFVITYNPTTGKLNMRVDGVLEINNQDMAQGTPTLNNVFIGAYVNTGVNFPITGLIGDVCVLDRVATADEIDDLEAFVAPRCGKTYPFDFVELTAPVPYQVAQRSGSTGSIAITGTIRPAGTYDVDARFNGGAWAITGTLSGQAQGQGMLEVRLVDQPTFITEVANVGIGDVFICAGQSNMSGRGTNNQVYGHATLKAGLFSNAYAWRELSDPYDMATSQTDTVSSDSSPAAAGSFIPLLATEIMADQGVPVAFVPAAKGGVSITSWLPGGDHQDRTTLYGSMVYRALQTGAKAVLWWQGETDAIDGMAQATYNGHLDTIADAIDADLGVPLMACKLQNSSAITDSPNEAAINAAIAEAWADNANVLEGPDLSDIGSDDAYHLQTDAKLLTAAQRWWAKLAAEFYP